MRKTIYLITLIFILVTTLISCQKISKNSDIVTTLFFQYDIVNNIVKDKLDVKLLSPLGTEVHDFEPTAKDIIEINNAKLFFYTSDEIDVWAKTVIKVNKIDGINLSDYLSENTMRHESDLHYWTDPEVFIKLIKHVTKEIISIDKINEDFYIENSDDYINKITAEINDFKNYLSNNSNNKSIYFWGHNALESFEHYFNLDIISLSTSYQPDSELTPKMIKTFKGLIINNNIKTIFIEELIDLKYINNFKKELALNNVTINVLELHSYHNISKTQFEKGVTYYDLFKQNIKNIKQSYDN